MNESFEYANSQMNELLFPLVSGPVLPATMLLAIMLLWASITFIGLGSHDTSHATSWLSHWIPDLSGHHLIPRELLDAGAYAIAWLKIREVPFVIWMCIFSFLWWTIAFLLFHLIDAPYLGTNGFLWCTLLTVRNWIIVLPITSVAVQPFRNMQLSEHIESQNIIGGECEISSFEATPEFGQARFKTGGAPLLLNVRTDGPHLPKGARVWITYFDAKRRVYLVTSSLGDSATESESKS